MDPTSLSTIVTVLIALSVASERLVEIIKGVIPILNNEHDDPIKESWRKASLQVLAVISGIITALLAREALGSDIPAAWNTTTGIIALGLLASGGSGFWNSILGYTNELKKLKKGEVVKQKTA